MKKLNLLLLITTTITILCGCNNQLDKTLIDKDYDGLHDEIDPNPESNEYRAKFKKSDGYTYTREISLKMDYRDYLPSSEPKKDLVRIASIFSLDSYEHYGATIITDYPYSSEDSEVFNLFGQFGLTNAKYVESSATVDSLDVCGLYLANHKFIVDNHKYQLFAFVVKGYVDSTGWASNFDLGADCENETAIFGEHPDWINKKNHKGFEVTGNRAFQLVEDYINEYKADGFETVLFGTGHSRGAAITNIVGKNIIDKYPDVKSSFYCFNPPLTTTESDDVKDSYEHIFNFICEQDLVSLVPIPNWGFDVYGQKYYFSHLNHLDNYEYIFKEPYDPLPEGFNDLAVDMLYSLGDTREKLYEFGKITGDGDVFEFETETEALAKKEELESCIDDEKARKCYLVSVIYPKDEEDLYIVQIKLMPCIIVRIATIFISAYAKGGADAGDILDQLIGLAPLLGRYIFPFINKYVEAGFDLTTAMTLPNKMKYTHGPLATVISCLFYESK